MSRTIFYRNNGTITNLLFIWIMIFCSIYRQKLPINYIYKIDKCIQYFLPDVYLFNIIYFVFVENWEKRSCGKTLNTTIDKCVCLLAFLCWRPLRSGWTNLGQSDVRHIINFIAGNKRILCKRQWTIMSNLSDLQEH